jgi:hypothetical protein
MRLRKADLWPWKGLLHRRDGLAVVFGLERPTFVLTGAVTEVASEAFSEVVIEGEVVMTEAFLKQFPTELAWKTFGRHGEQSQRSAEIEPSLSSDTSGVAKSPTRSYESWSTETETASKLRLDALPATSASRATPACLKPTILDTPLNGSDIQHNAAEAAESSGAPSLSSASTSAASEGKDALFSHLISAFTVNSQFTDDMPTSRATVDSVSSPMVPLRRADPLQRVEGEGSAGSLRARPESASSNRAATSLQVNERSDQTDIDPYNDAVPDTYLDAKRFWSSLGLSVGPVRTVRVKNNGYLHLRTVTKKLGMKKQFTKRVPQD